jgi:hypothetical protein
MLPLFLLFASQVSVETPTFVPRASEGWSLDVNVSARSTTSPWLIVGLEQRIDDNISIRAAVESGVFFVADRLTVDDARLGVATVVGPRFAFNPGDPFVLSAYALGGIGTRSGALDAPLLVEHMVFHGTLRLGAAIDWAVSEHVSIRVSSDLVEGRTGWRLGDASLPADKRISDQYTLLNVGITPTLGMVFEL